MSTDESFPLSVENGVVLLLHSFFASGEFNHLLAVILAERQS